MMYRRACLCRRQFLRDMRTQRRIPFGLILRVHLPLCVVADVANLRKASNVELGRAELRHDGGWRNELPGFGALHDCR